MFILHNTVEVCSKLNQYLFEANYIQSVTIWTDLTLLRYVIMIPTQQATLRQIIQQFYTPCCHTKFFQAIKSSTTD